MGRIILSGLAASFMMNPDAHDDWKVQMQVYWHHDSSTINNNDPARNGGNTGSKYSQDDVEEQVSLIVAQVQSVY